MYKHGECVKKCKFLSQTFYNMSGHGQCSPSRILKSSPKLPKIGALNVTIPISCVMKQSSGSKSSSSTPTYSPTTWKNRSDPSGKRSPGSSSFKERIRPLDLFGSIRRSASLDTIYLKGNWPRRSYWISRALHINKATQTDESYCSELKQFLCIRESERTTDQPTQRQEIGTKEPVSKHLSPGESSLGGSSSKSSSSSVTIKPLPRPSFRSSVEGLNQEIERIVQSSNSELHSTRPFHSGNFLYHEAPEGHRAPLEDLLGKPRSQSVNTQTPHGFGSSSRSSEGSQGSSPDQESTSLGPSPRINKFIAREPPDGCEKIQSKTMSSRRYLPMEHVPQPKTFKLKQSVGSAFEPLQPSTSNTLDQDLPLVPYEDSERDK